MSDNHLSIPCVWSSGIDWFRYTVPKTDKITYQQELDRAWFHVSCGETDGFKRFPVTFFKQFDGHRCGSWGFGISDYGLMVEASSDAAHRLAREVVQDEVTLKLTRVDFQDTWRHPGIKPESYYPNLRQKLRYWEQQNAGKHKRPVCLRDYPETGSSVEIGRRSDARFTRLYDKTKEQKSMVEPFLHRAEDQCNGVLAARLYDTIRASDDHRRLARNIVTARLQELHIWESWMDDPEPVQMPSSYEPSDLEKLTRWAKRDLPKPLRKLLEAYGPEWFIETFKLELWLKP